MLSIDNVTFITGETAHSLAAQRNRTLISSVNTRWDLNVENEFRTGIFILSLSNFC